VIVNMRTGQTNIAEINGTLSQLSLQTCTQRTGYSDRAGIGCGFESIWGDSTVVDQGLSSLIATLSCNLDFSSYY